MNKIHLGKIGNMNILSYKGKKVLITGNTGFKGSWLAFWLIKLGANVVGYSLKPDIDFSHFQKLNLDYQTFFKDINDYESLNRIIKSTSPDIIFHLAAQPLVRYSYSNTIETYATNILGTANVLEATRYNENIKAVIIVTTDKCYENTDKKIGYVEFDRLGGYDPYSSSKACAEIITNSYRQSFFNLEKFKINHNTLIATARAGNVIGGGDWSIDRLIPDIVKAAMAGNESIIRSPHSTRPWQHVLEPLSGYLLLGEKLLNDEVEFAEAWNFGPEENSTLTVKQVLDKAKNYWNKINYIIKEDEFKLHEANYLSLNIEKAKNKLKWKPIWSNDLAIEKTINWYKNFYNNGILETDQNIDQFINNF